MQSDDARSIELKWIADHRESLEQDHAGEWIAVQGDQLIAVGPRLKDVLAEARGKGYSDPLISAVRAKKYQGVMMFRRWR